MIFPTSHDSGINGSSRFACQGRRLDANAKQLSTLRHGCSKKTWEKTREPRLCRVGPEARSELCRVERVFFCEPRETIPPEEQSLTYCS